MSYKSAISWTDSTWNPVIGCSKISAGCVHCYAERTAGRQANMGNTNYQGVVYSERGEWLADWNGKTVFVESALTKPLRWKQPRKIFVCSMGDLFHESVPFGWIDRVMDVVVQCPQHLFYFLTKRAARQREYVEEIVSGKRILHQLFGDRLAVPDSMVNHANRLPPYKMPANLHLGVTVEKQDNVGRIADLEQTPAAGRFVSLEPLLPGLPKVNLWRHQLETLAAYAGGRPSSHIKNPTPKLDYAFIGCESGPKARLCSLDDIRYVMQQCRDAGVKVHVKQLPLKGKCNKNFVEWPPEFQVREV